MKRGDILRFSRIFAIIAVVLLVVSFLVINFGWENVVTPKTMTLGEVENLSNAPSTVQIYGNQINVTGSAVIPVEMGPMESNVSMYSFSIFGLINPTIRLNNGTTVSFMEINIDDDSSHNFAITTSPPPYYYMGGGMMGHSNMMSYGNMLMSEPILKHHSGNNYYYYQSQLTTGQNETLWYVCQVPGHAANGMYGEIVIS